MKYIISILLIVISTKSFGQNSEIKSSDITSFTYPFNIENNKLIGLGADTLKNAIRESQFFMLGEEHMSPEISELTNVLLPYFCIRLSKYIFFDKNGLFSFGAKK